MFIRRQTPVMIVRGAQVVLVDAAGGEAAVPGRRLPIRRRAGDRRERAGGGAEDRRVRFGIRRHAEGRLRVAGSALGHGPVLSMRVLAPHPRVLPPQQRLGGLAAAGLERVARQQLRPLVVHGNRDLPGAGAAGATGLLEGRGPTVAVGLRASATDRLLPIGSRLGTTRRLFVARLILRRDHRKLRTHRLARQTALLAPERHTLLEPWAIQLAMGLRESKQRIISPAPITSRRTEGRTERTCTFVRYEAQLPNSRAFLFEYFFSFQLAYTYAHTDIHISLFAQFFLRPLRRNTDVFRFFW